MGMYYKYVSIERIDALKQSFWRTIMKFLTNIIVIIALATSLASNAFAGKYTSASAKLERIEKCFKKAEFTKGFSEADKKDYYVVKRNRKIAGREILTGFTFRFSRIILSEDSLRKKIDACMPHITND
jgi:hypothetical protein